MSRIVKQLIYGLFFLLILAFVGGGVYYLFFFRNVAQYQNPDIKPLIISSVEVFENNNQSITVLAEINNPNKNIGAGRLPYRVNLFDYSGKEIFSKDRETFIYPDKNRTIVEAGINIAVKNIDQAKVEIVVDGVVWQEEEKFGGIPEKNIQVEKVTFQSGGKESILSGNLINNNPFKLEKILIKAILYDKNGLKQNASQTLLEGIEAFKNYNFLIKVLLKKEIISQIDPNRTKIIIEALR